MGILYSVNDHIQYWIHPKDTNILVKGHIVGFQETGHKTMAYHVKRDHHHTLQDNVGMYENTNVDLVFPASVLGTVTTKKA